jgi:peptide/nickel transport system substrate-binding protein
LAPAAPTQASGSAAPTTASTTAASSPTATLRVGTRVDPQSLDPHHYKAGGIDIAVIGLITDGLLSFDRQMQVQPALATAWDWTDSTTLRLTLRKGVTFQDGTPFNAQAAKVNLDRMAAAAEVKGYYGELGSTDIVDDNTVVLHLKSASAPFLRNLAAPLGGMLSPAAIEKYGADLPRNPVGTGRYKLDQWLPNQRLVVTRNTAYWGSAPKIDTLTFRPFPDESTRLLSFQAGELDVIQDPVPSSVKSIEADPRFQVVKTTQLRNLWLGMEAGDQTLADLKLRQAIAYAIDRRSLVNDVAEGLAEVAESLIPSSMMQLSQVAYPFDPAKAKQLLAEAGHANGLSVNLWAPQGRYLKDKEIGEAIQAQLQQVGIKADLQVSEWGAYNKAIMEHKQQLWIQGWGFIAGDPDGLASLFGSAGAFNSFNLKDEQVDQLFAKGVATTDDSGRKTIYGDLQKRLIQDLATVVPIYFQQGFYATTRKVHDFYPHPLELIDVSQATIEA